MKNADVNGNNSNATVDIWRHDFWGQDLRNESSHKSYRPVTTLSFLWQYRLSKGSPRAFHVFNLACHVCVTTLVGLVTSTILRGTHAPKGLEVTEDGVEAGAEAPVRGGKGETASPKKVAFMLPVQKKGGELKVAVGGSNGTDRAGRDRSPRNGSPRRQNAACDGPEGLDKTLSRGNDVDVAKDEDLSRAACARWACAIFGTHPVHVEAVPLNLAYMHSRMHVCMHISKACLSFHQHASSVHVRACTRAHVHVCTYMCIHSYHLHAWMRRWPTLCHGPKYYQPSSISPPSSLIVMPSWHHSPALEPQAALRLPPTAASRGEGDSGRCGS